MGIHLTEKIAPCCVKESGQITQSNRNIKTTLFLQDQNVGKSQS